MRCSTLRQFSARLAMKMPCAGSMRFFFASPNSTPALESARYIGKQRCVQFFGMRLRLSVGLKAKRRKTFFTWRNAAEARGKVPLTSVHRENAHSVYAIGRATECDIRLFEHEFRVALEKFLHNALIFFRGECAVEYTKMPPSRTHCAAEDKIAS